MRLFVGARVSVATANALAACAEMLERRSKDAGIALKFVAPANYHVTLKFLGHTREEAVGAVRDAVAAACTGVAPIKFRCARLGAFASVERANVVWAGVEDGGALGELAKKIDAACARLGFAAEPRAFHAHVTLARLRETRPVRELVLPLSEQMFSDTRIDGVTLFESQTKPSGSVYQEIERISFKPAETAPERQTSSLDMGEETDDGWPRGHGGDHI